MRISQRSGELMTEYLPFPSSFRRHFYPINRGLGLTHSSHQNLKASEEKERKRKKEREGKNSRNSEENSRVFLRGGVV